MVGEHFNIKHLVKNSDLPLALLLPTTASCKSNNTTGHRFIHAAEENQLYH